MLISDFLYRRYIPARLLGRSEFTTQQYAFAVRAFEKFAQRPLLLEDFTEDFLNQFAAFRLKDHSPADTAKNLRHIATLLRWAVRFGLLARMPLVPPIKKVRRIPRAWSLEEIAALLDAAGQETGFVGSVGAPLFWRSYILVVFDTGLRLRTVLNLKPTDVDLPRRQIVAPPERIKDGEELICPISDETAIAIDSMRPTVEWEYLFPWEFDRYPRATFTAFNRRFRRIVKRAGLSNDFKLSQRIRRTRATYGEIACPGSATRDLGHSSRQVTTDSYIDTRLLGVQRVVDLLPRPVLPTPVLKLYTGD